MACQPGTMKTGPVWCFSQLWCWHALLSSPCPTQTCFQLPPQHFHLCTEPGQARFPYLCSEFCPRAADISFPASSLWVRASLFSPKGSTNFHPQNSIQDLWSLSSKVALDFFLKISKPPANSAQQGYCEESTSVHAQRPPFTPFSRWLACITWRRESSPVIPSWTKKACSRASFGST